MSTLEATTSPDHPTQTGGRRLSKRSSKTTRLPSSQEEGMHGEVGEEEEGVKEEEEEASLASVFVTPTKQWAASVKLTLAKETRLSIAEESF